jgi:FtsZ-binding cell division protein ZapB
MLNEKKRIADELSDLQNQRDALRTKVEMLRGKKQDLEFQKSKVED